MANTEIVKYTYPRIYNSKTWNKNYTKKGKCKIHQNKYAQIRKQIM